MLFFHRESCSAVSNSALATSASTSRLLNARSSAFMANLMVTPTMIIADNEIQPYHKPLEVLKPSVTSRNQLQGIVKNEPAKTMQNVIARVQENECSQCESERKQLHHNLGLGLHILGGQKSCFSASPRAILRCNQEIAKGICSRCLEKFCSGLLDSQSFQKRLFFPHKFPTRSPGP